MNTSKHSTVWKRIMPVIITVLLLSAFAATVSAGAFDDFYDYQNPDGTYSYYFTQGVTVTMNEDWYQKTMVIPGDSGAAFYHKASYQAYEQKGLEGGRLFTISASVNTDFQNLPSFEYIGFDENEYMNYFAVLPTDYQAYTEDESIRAEYDALWSEVKTVIAGIELSGASSSSSGAESSPEVQETSEESLYTRVSRDDFSFEIPSGWVCWTLDDPDTLLASADGSDTPPLFFVQEAGEVKAGDYIAELKKEFLNTYRDGIVSEPELITYEPEDAGRKLAGFRGVFTTAGDPTEYTVLEYVEYFDDDLYHYYCCYVSGAAEEGEYEDETTYFEFHHAIDTMIEDD